MIDYYAHGFSRLDAPMRKYICIAGVSSFLAESVIEQLLEDARVARHVDALSDLVLEEFNFIASLGANIYDRLVCVLLVILVTRVQIFSLMSSILSTHREPSWRS